MSETVSFPSNGSTAGGYLTTPTAGAGPGVLVVQEWWGLDSGIKTVCDMLADEGFTALAPDLYHGELAKHDEMDRAGELMNAMPMDRAARDMSGAIDFLAKHEAVRGDGVGVVGYCMGGMLAFVLACTRPDSIKAVVAYYGAPIGDDQPDFTKLAAPVLCHAAADDGFFPADAIVGLAEKLRDMGKSVEADVYPNTGHAFASEHNALGTRDDSAARQAWVRTLEFLRAHLG